MAEILKKINDKRKLLIEKKGITFGHIIPEVRKVPLVKPDFSKGVIISEIKRGSPSAGRISDIKDPVMLASSYLSGGASVISVLTEEEHFFGSLDDLMKVKNSFPDACILRKDFIQFEEEMEVTYNAGADMVLLIVASYNGSDDERKHLKRLYDAAVKAGLTPLVETHNEDEIKVALSIGADVIGINTRDLKTFIIDRNKAHYLRDLIPQGVNAVYESGIRSGYEGYLAGCSGFKGILVGTSLVKNRDAEYGVKKLCECFRKGLNDKRGFFKRIFTEIYSGRKPVVKICGITNLSDAVQAVNNGAFMIGFVMAESKRRIEPEKIREIVRELDKKVNKEYFKVAVVTEYTEDAVALYNDGVIDCIQYHGISDEDFINEALHLWYKAVNMKSVNDYPSDTLSPFILIDAFSENEKGGSGKRVNEQLVKEVLNITQNHLHIAGGINPANVGEIIKDYKPDMIDLSSGVEYSPGVKDHEKIKELFGSIKNENTIR